MTDTPLNGAGGETLDDMMERARSAYVNAFNDVLDTVLAEFLLADEKVKICLDAMQFFTFIATIKAVEARGQKPTRENLMAVYWPMQKALKDDVPGMLRTFADEAGKAEA